MKRGGVIAGIAGLAVLLGGIGMLPWGGPPEAAFRGVERVVVHRDGVVRPLAPGEGKLLVQSIAACPPVSMPDRLMGCTPASATTVSWDASGYPVRAAVSDQRIWLSYKGGPGPCSGRYVMDCGVPIPEPQKIELPPLRSDVVTLRAHAKMLSVLAGREADPQWLDDLDSLKGDTRFLVSATGDEVGWRVEGSGREFILAMRAIAARRMPDLASRASGWSAEGASAVEVVVGAHGWTRFETTGDIAQAKAYLGGDIPPAPLDRVLGALPRGAALWIGFWTSNGRTGAVVANRHHAGTADVIVDGEISKVRGKKDRQIVTTRSLAGGDALGCIDTLSADGATGHGARLGKVFAELGAASCEGVRLHGFGEDRSWIVEIRPR